MAYFPVVNDILEVRVVCFQQDQVGINVYHHKVTAVLGAGLSQGQLAQSIDGILAPLYKAAICNLATYRGIAVQKLRPVPRPPAEFTIGNTAVGTGGATLMPRQTCGLIACFTNLAGPRYRGRAYIPFPSAQFQTASADAPTPAYIALLNPIASNVYQSVTYFSGVNQVTLKPVLFNRAIVAPRPPQPETTTDIVNAAVRPLWATQRRRGDYGRTNFSPF